MKKCKLVQNIMNFKFCYIIFCTIICFIVLSVPTFAKENSDNVIRVGSFEETYNTVNEKGERSGYGYEYLQDIAGYAGWTYKYITSDWKNCFTQLENGEIDILGDISYTDERAENMLFSDMPMGEEKYYIYTDASNMDLTAGNLDSFEGKNIGVSKDNIVEDVLNEWESKYGLHTKHINVSTTTEIMDKLSKHEIDCFVSVEESRWEESDISPLTSIGETEIYFAINPERPDILISDLITHLGDRQIGAAQQLLCAVDAQHGQIVLKSHSCFLLELGAEIIRTESRNARDLFQRDIIHILLFHELLRHQERMGLISRTASYRFVEQPQRQCI